MTVYFLICTVLEIIGVLWQTLRLRAVKVMPPEKMTPEDNHTFQSFLYKRSQFSFTMLIAAVFTCLAVVGVLYILSPDSFGESRTAVFWCLIVGYPVLYGLTLGRQRCAESYIWVEDGNLTFHGLVQTVTYRLDQLDRVVVLYNSDVDSNQLIVYVDKTKLFTLVGSDPNFQKMVSLMEEYGYIERLKVPKDLVWPPKKTKKSKDKKGQAPKTGKKKRR